MSDDRDVEEIRQDIEQNRDDMSRTIDQIEARLTPEAIQTQVNDIVRQTTDQLLAQFNEKSDTIAARINEEVRSAIHGATAARTEQLFAEVDEIVRKAGHMLWERTAHNPAPLALMATAIGLIASERPDGTGDGSPGFVEQAKRMVGEQASSVKSDVSAMTDETGGKIADLASDARVGAYDLVSKVPDPGSFWNDQPLTIGLLATGLGFVAALSLPQSNKEREMMAPVIDKAQTRLDEMGITDSTAQSDGGIVGQAKAMGSDLISQAKDAASASLSQAGDAASSIGRTAVESAKSPQLE
jgi:Protein of unknown function (DUF3618)